MTRRGAARCTAFALGLLLPAAAWPAESAPGLAPPPASSFQAFTHPSDDGQTINLEWGRSRDEASGVYYVVEMASNEADYKAGRFRRVARIPSLAKLKSDEKRLRNYEDEAVNRANKQLHYLAVEPTTAYPDDAKTVRERDCYFRLAIVGTRMTKEKRPKAPEPLPEKPEAKPRMPVLAAAEAKSEEFLKQLESLQGTLTKATETKKSLDQLKRQLDALRQAMAEADKSSESLGQFPAFLGTLARAAEAIEREWRPLATALYLRLVGPIEGQSAGVTVVHDECLGELRALDQALANRGPAALRHEAEHWREQQAQEEAEAKLKAETPRKEEYEEVEVEKDGEPVFVSEGGAPKVVKARATLPPLVRPQAEGFRAFDLPSDDGADIAVEWRRTPSENRRTAYVVEIAEVKDGVPGPFEKAAEVPSLGAEKSDQPKFFGFSEANKLLHCVRVQPAAAFPPDALALRQRVIEEQMAWMPADWAPDTDFPQRLPPLLAALSAYVEAAKGICADIEALRGGLAAKLELADKTFLPELAGYRAYADRLGRFDAHVGSRLADALKDAKQEASRRSYAFRVAIRRGEETLHIQQDNKPKDALAAARPNLFKWFKLNNLVLSLAFCSVVYAFIGLARRNPNLFIRKIAGLDAVEEAIGRATEMGRPVYFVHGLGGMGGLSTIAAVNILARVARRAAEYDTRVRVMNNDPIVQAVSQEVVKQSYTEAGRPDAYNADDVALVAPDQFSYVAAVGGLMVREQPATIFLMGYFFAESLLLAETGASTGAIQIAGTDSYTQIPFFITACDYTLIGEEIFAASAYLSREPKMLGSLRGQDVGKAVVMIAIVAGTLALTLAAALGYDWSIIQKLFEAF
ncbi:MAG: hypothetical protein FJ291_00755 [Planctomycetes bacterium]|nr:hypothetical protein [Planctomycetota bacterium]